MSEQMKDQAAAQQPEEESLSELLQIRRDKLTRLCEAGHDPFQVTASPARPLCPANPRPFRGTGEPGCLHSGPDHQPAAYG